MNCFLITTYNRPESCQRLVDSLRGLGDIYVVNDGCDYVIKGCTQYFQKPNLGKKGYWETVNRLFKMKGLHEYYFMLPDDFLPTDNMVIRAIELWQNINDPRKICLNLDGDRQGVACWTNFQPIDKGDVWLTQWVDMCFMCKDMFFRALKLIPKRFPVASRSSGVGAYISRKLYNQKYNLYQVKEALAVPQPEHSKSQMNPCVQHT